MAFSVTDNYTVLTPNAGVYHPAVVEQAGEFYAIRLRPPADPTSSTIFESDSLGPYATQEDAQAHLGELPPVPPQPPPPPLTPPGMVQESEPEA